LKRESSRTEKLILEPKLRNASASSDQIADYLREAIMNGTLAEGKPVRQDEVARQFAVSKIPVREALKRLEAEGLLTFYRNRGAVVTEVSEFEILQIFEVRALLEAQAITLSVPNMKPQTLLLAEQYCNRFASERDVARWAQLNWDFHSCLYNDASRPYLVSLIRSVNDRIERYLRMQLTLSDGQARADREHREILRACRAGDAKEAARLTSNHIMDACHSLLRSIHKS
jgi:DNA-binding GntR family transcriptional regulator